MIITVRPDQSLQIRRTVKSRNLRRILDGEVASFSVRLNLNDKVLRESLFICLLCIALRIKGADSTSWYVKNLRGPIITKIVVSVRLFE
jgi:hypothetical protein